MPASAADQPQVVEPRQRQRDLLPDIGPARRLEYGRWQFRPLLLRPLQAQQVDELRARQVQHGGSVARPSGRPAAVAGPSCRRIMFRRQAVHASARYGVSCSLKARSVSLKGARGSAR